MTIKLLRPAVKILDMGRNLTTSEDDNIVDYIPGDICLKFEGSPLARSLTMTRKRAID